MGTKREREYYRMGFTDGLRVGRGGDIQFGLDDRHRSVVEYERARPKKRKLSEWQRFVKANSKKPRFRYKSGAKRGKINLKALGVAYRKRRGDSVPYEDYNLEQLLMRFLLAAVAILEGLRYVD